MRSRKSEIRGNLRTLRILKNKNSNNNKIMALRSLILLNIKNLDFIRTDFYPKQYETNHSSMVDYDSNGNIVYYTESWESETDAVLWISFKFKGKKFHEERFIVEEGEGIISVWDNNPLNE